MRVSLRRPPTAWERLLGRRRVKWLRRRVGFVALGAGVALLRPRTRLAPVGAIVAVTTLVAVVAAIRVA